VASELLELEVVQYEANYLDHSAELTAADGVAHAEFSVDPGYDHDVD
jgi:hypothetical protein